jgi:hypothetical protein
MSRGKSIVHHEDKITATSSNNDNDNHESLGVDQEETLEVQASTHDFASSSAMSQCRGGPFTIGSLHSEIHSPTSIRLNGRMIF